METKINFETYLFLSSCKIAIAVYDKSNLNNLYFKEVTNFDEKKDFDFEVVEDFLEKNIFEIEKKLKNFVKHINLILESVEFLTILISVKKGKNKKFIFLSIG